MPNNPADPDLVLIEPDKEYEFPIPENISSLLVSLPEEEKELVVCRVSISDQAGFGVLIPAFLNVTNFSEFFFTLPDQLCIFSPNLTYLLKMELILPSQLITPFIKTAKIAPGAPLESEKTLDGSEDVEKKEAANEAYKVTESVVIDPELEMALEAIAPLPLPPTSTIPKITLEELDEEFVKHALWNVPVPTPKVFVGSKEQQPQPQKLENPSSSALKRKMKDLFR